MNTKTIPPMDEFIDLSQRSRESEPRGFPPMSDRATVAIYNTAAGYQTLTVRISEDLADKYGLVVGARMVCRVHPDQSHLALLPAGPGVRGAALFHQKQGRAMVYQSTLRAGTLEPQPATEAKLSRIDGALVITLSGE